jgi:hypothetical protein
MTVHPDRGFRSIFWAFAIVFGVPGAVAFVLAVVELVLQPFDGGPVAGGLVALGGGAVFVGVGLFFAWVARRPGPALTLRVSADKLTMLRRGAQPAAVRRSEAALVVVDSVAGQPDLYVYGPDRQLVGHWESNWMKTPLRTVRALRRFGWPWALRDQAITSGRSSTHHSKDAPAWADEVMA